MPDDIKFPLTGKQKVRAAAVYEAPDAPGISPEEIAKAQAELRGEKLELDADNPEAETPEETLEAQGAPTEPKTEDESHAPGEHAEEVQTSQDPGTAGPADVQAPRSEAEDPAPGDETAPDGTSVVEADLAAQEAVKEDVVPDASTTKTQTRRSSKKD